MVTLKPHVYGADIQSTKKMKQSFIMVWQKHHLRRDMVTTRGLSNMRGTEMTLSCQNIPGILQVLIKFQPWNGAFSEKYTETQKLCLTEKYFILNDLGDNKLLNKKSEFVNKCRHLNKVVFYVMTV